MNTVKTISASIVSIFIQTKTGIVTNDIYSIGHFMKNEFGCTWVKYIEATYEIDYIFGGNKDPFVGYSREIVGIGGCRIV